MKIANPSTRPVAKTGAGRPKGVDRLVERLIGVVGVSVLREHDLIVVPGKRLRDLATLLPEEQEPEDKKAEKKEAAA